MCATSMLLSTNFLACLSVQIERQCAATPFVKSVEAVGPGCAFRVCWIAGTSRMGWIKIYIVASGGL